MGRAIAAWATYSPNFTIDLLAKALGYVAAQTAGLGDLDMVPIDATMPTRQT